MPPQVLRLVLVTCGIVASYLAGRHLLTPPTFGQYGHYRGAALGEISARDPVFAGQKECLECHSETFALQAKDHHKTISCEACHGPSRTHAANPDAPLQRLTNDLCLRCHALEPARPAMQHQVDAADHFAGDKCVECHLPHEPAKSP
jgi:predicted CXXCH cytochrome family protein